ARLFALRSSLDCGPGDRPDVGERAAGVPGWKGPHERGGTVEPDASPERRLRPGKVAGVPFDEGFGFRSDVEVLRAGVRLADLGLSQLDEQPVALTALSAEVEADDDASIWEPLSTERVAHRPQCHEGV